MYIAIASHERPNQLQNRTLSLLKNINLILKMFIFLYLQVHIKNICLFVKNGDVTVKSKDSILKQEII